MRLACGVLGYEAGNERNADDGYYLLGSTTIAQTDIHACGIAGCTSSVGKRLDGERWCYTCL